MKGLDDYLTREPEEGAQPHAFYSLDDKKGESWEILIEGDYEAYADGNDIVTDLRVGYYMTKGERVDESRVPAEILDFVEALMEDPNTYTEMVYNYEVGEQ